MRARQDNGSRREFLRGVTRYSGLSLLALFTAGTILKNRSRTCQNAGVCSGCWAFEECSLPPALDRKHGGAGS